MTQEREAKARIFVRRFHTILLRTRLKNAKRKLNQTRFSAKAFSRAVANQILVILCHARYLPQRIDKLLNKIPDKDEKKKLQKAAELIKIHASVKSVGAPREKELTRRISEASTQGDEISEEADEKARKPVTGERGGVKKQVVAQRPKGSSPSMTAPSKSFEMVKLLQCPEKSYVLRRGGKGEEGKWPLVIEVTKSTTPARTPGW